MRLYSYYRSSASYRVRIALNLKGVEAEIVPIDLAKRDQLTPEYLSVNPQGLVPALDTGAGLLTQSTAILEWLEETHQNPPLLPSDPMTRARVRAMAGLVGADIHPLQSRRVLSHLKHDYKVEQEGVYAWARHWTRLGLEALETLVARDGGRFAFGETPTLADVFLVPQLYNARVYGLDLAPFPRLLDVERECGIIWSFAAAHPDGQPDAPKPTQDA